MMHSDAFHHCHRFSKNPQMPMEVPKPEYGINKRVRTSNAIKYSHSNARTKLHDK